MPWPLSQDYNEAIQTPAQCFHDPELKQSEAVCNALGMPEPSSGNFADVYAVESGQRKWAVKCFTRQIPGLKERYAAVSTYLQQVSLPFMVDFRFLEQGIRIRGQWFPILKMQWVEGLPLNVFVRDNLDKPQILDGLCQIWLKMAVRLREANLAHCDLQHGNVLMVQGASAGKLGVKLVDYDGMCVPALELLKSIELGHPAYQHPQRLREGTYGLHIDRFPHLVIYTALRSLVVGGRRLWDQFDNGDNLLFKQKDFESPGSAPVFQELRKLNDPQVQKLVATLAQAAQKPVEQVPLLEELVGSPKPVKAPAPRKTNVSAAKPVEKDMSWSAVASGKSSEAPSRGRKRNVAVVLVLMAVALVGSMALGGLWLFAGGDKKPASAQAKLATKSSASLPAINLASTQRQPSTQRQLLTNREPKGNPPEQRRSWFEGFDVSQLEVRIVGGVVGRTGRLEVKDDVVQLQPTQVLTSKQSFSGPNEFIVVAKTEKNNIRLHAFNGACVIFNWECNPRELRITRPDGAPDKLESGSVATAPVEPLTPNVWHTLRWRITDERQEVYADDKLVFAESRKYDLSAKLPMRVASADSRVDVKSVIVRSVERTPLVQESPTYLDDMQEVKMNTLWRDRLKKKESNPPPSLGGHKTKHYLFLHPPGPGVSADVVYRLDSQFAEFRASVGLSDAIPMPAWSPLTFRVVGDGKVMWQSKPVREKGQVQDCVLDIRGVKTLVLQVAPAGSHIHANVLWDQPRVYKTFRPERREAIDWLHLIDPKRDTTRGNWAFQGKTLVGTAGDNRLRIPYMLPEEYHLSMVVERKQDDLCIGVGLKAAGRRFLVALDHWPQRGYRSGLQLLDGKNVIDQAEAHRGQVLLKGKPTEIDIDVRKTGVTVTAAGKSLVDFKGNYGRLSLEEELTKAMPDTEVFLGSSNIAFHKMELTPISGQGKVLVDAGPAAPVDLLRLIDPKKDAVQGKWGFQGKSLIVSTEGVARLQIPYLPPEEYAITVMAERKSAKGSFVAGLIVGGRQCMAELDGYVEGRDKLSWLRVIDGKEEGNPTFHNGLVLTTGKASKIVCSVRKADVTVTVDGKRIILYKGDAKRLSMPPGWTVPNNQVLFLGTHLGNYHITKMELTPISGEGKVLYYLSNMMESDVVGAKGLGKGFITSGDPNRIVVNGTEYPHGIGLHPPGDRSTARVRYRLDKQYATFRSQVAINDSASPAGPKSPLIFQVYGDGKPLWTSRPVKAVRSIEKCEVSVAGVTELEVRVICPGRYDYAHAVWLDPRLLK